MLGSRRSSVISPPPLSPMSPSAITRPHSSAGHAGHSRMMSDNVSVSGSSEPDSRNVRVVVRIRPSNPDDASVPPRFRQALVHPISPSELRVDVDPSALAGQTPSAGGPSKRHPTFGFDHVLGEEASQVDLYDCTAREVVDEFVKGHNVTFLAYGQTSSGKSYSMGTTGEDIDYSGTEFTPRTGLIPRTVQTIFERAEDIRLSSGAGATWECRLSFLELYNEEIIDLLSGSGVQITIREEREGRIVWSGIREVRVKTLAEVMQLLQEGSARRKTGETGMNATSSRSHAIFSLTMVQKKRTGITAALPTPPADRPNTPNRGLKRPSSTNGISAVRASTPTAGRTAPPSSFASKSGIPQRSSMYGVQTITPPGNDEFVIVTSKFNMVDLAGSERLKRTAAQGERMKEGISINSGLLALGNVISTLADPVKARGHVPYRDSKLTRMLQDSIGGNALTTMIACVSPIEFNVTETLNTIKYASRARNIKNAAKINAVEAGWDDVEHLQNTVLKLRKQVAVLEAEGKAGGSAIGTMSEEGQRQSEKLIVRLSELQKEHTELYDQYLQKCSDNMRLTTELRSAKPGDADSLAKFNETVEPVILEYEKVVSALNKQLDELRLEISMVNDLYEEQGRQLQDARERQIQSENYASELRGRVAKLNERNHSSEAYIHDLEAKFKAHAEKEDSHGVASAELRKEIAKLKESNSTLHQHTVALEARLAKSEAHSHDHGAQIERHEKDAAKREAAYRDLEAHINLLDTSKDNKVLLAELEQRDSRIAELEKQHETIRDEERANLQKAVAEKAVQVELREQVSGLQSSAKAGQESKSMSKKLSSVVLRDITPPASPPPTDEDTDGDDQGAELRRLKQLLQELSARCTDAESRYSEAEGKITELTTQLSEVKLIHDEIDDVLPLSPGMTSPSDDVSENGSTVQTPRTQELSISPKGSRRGSRPVSSGSMVGAKGKDFLGGRGFREYRAARPQSLSQELSSAQSLGLSSRASWGGPSSLLLGASPTRLSMPVMQEQLRSQRSLEAELKFVHRIVEERDEELRDREAYIRHLEGTLRQSHSIPSRTNSATSLSTPKQSPSGTPPRPCDIPLPPSPTAPVIQLPVEEPQTPKKGYLRPPSLAHLSPISAKKFSDLRESLDGLESGATNVNETQGRVDELMREMAVKEASQRQIIEQQFIQIADLQKANHRLREELADGSPGLERALEELEELRKERNEFTRNVPASPVPASPAPSSDSVLNRLREEHAEELQAVINGHAENVNSLREQHNIVLQELRTTLETTKNDLSSKLETHRVEREAAIADLQRAHQVALDALQKDNELLASELETSIGASEEQRRQLKMKADQAMFELSRVRDEHQVAKTADYKQIAELLKGKAVLEKTIGELELAKADLTLRNSELEGVRADLAKRNSELENRWSKRTTTLPPQGPPPNLPLPPLPANAPAATQAGKIPSERTNSMSSAGHRSNESLGAEEDISQSKVEEEETSRLQLIEAERDKLRQQLEAGKASSKDAEVKLQEQLTKAESLVKELADSRKTNSKLRAHLEDARQENKRASEACKQHMDELAERRSKMDELDSNRRHERDSLVAANAQVASLRAQLERAVDAKVNKKMNSKLKCF